MADNFQITQGAGTFLATDQAGSGEHYQKVKLIDPTPDSTTPIGTASNPFKVDGSGVTQPVSGTVAVSNFPTATLCASAVGASGAAVTATLPAVVGQFHVIQAIEIVKFYVANINGTATPVTVTTTNLPGSLAFTFGNAGAIGTVDNSSFKLYSELKLQSSVANTPTTIVCPATTNIIWRVNVFYYLSS